MSRIVFAPLLVLLARPAAGQPAPAKPAQPAATCIECHLALDDARVSPPAKAVKDDVHFANGFSCVSCHGGDGTKDDQALAHDAKKGFRGKPTPREIPELCGKCHADAELMKKFKPSLRVDQLAEYRSSGHGKALAKGDTTVAQCASCHGAHGILPVKDLRSPVSSPNVAKTCDHCHGDAKLMASHKLPSDVYAKYAKSAHFAARQKGDMSAPTCNSCHGNHGAVPPEVGSVANVCGTCHVVFADQFKQSPHAQAFKDLGLPGCVTCHENHEILPPTDAYLADGPQGKCSSCHEKGSKGAVAAATMLSDITRLDTETKEAKRVVGRAAEAGMEVSRVQFELGKADEALVKARADVHFFRVSAVEKTSTEGLGVARKALADGKKSLAELDYRRTGLVISLGLICLAIVFLLLKIRDIDRQRTQG